MTREEVRTFIDQRVLEIMAQAAVQLLTKPPSIANADERVKWMAEHGAWEAKERGIRAETWRFDVSARLAEHICAQLAPEQRTLAEISAVLRLPR